MSPGIFPIQQYIQPTKDNSMLSLSHTKLLSLTDDMNTRHVSISPQYAS